MLQEAAARLIKEFVSGGAVVRVAGGGRYGSTGEGDVRELLKAAVSPASGAGREMQGDGSVEEAVEGQAIEGGHLWAALGALPFLAASHVSGSDQRGVAVEMCVKSAELLLQGLRDSPPAALESSRTAALQCLLSSALQSITALASVSASDSRTSSTSGGNRSLQPQALLPVFWTAVKEQSGSPLVLAAAAEFLQRFGETPHSHEQTPPLPLPSSATGSQQPARLLYPSWDDVLPSLLPALSNASLAARTAALQLLPLLRVEGEGEGEGGKGQGEGGKQEGRAMQGMTAGSADKRTRSEESEEPACSPWPEVIEVSGMALHVDLAGTVQWMASGLSDGQKAHSVHDWRPDWFQSSSNHACLRLHKETIEPGSSRFAKSHLNCRSVGNAGLQSKQT